MFTFGARGALALNAMGAVGAVGKLFRGGYGATAAGAAWGGAAGAGWGMVSDDTSVLGGMAMGATAGAVGGRYGSAAMKGWNNAAGQFASGAYRGGFATLGRNAGSKFSADMRSLYGMSSRGVTIGTQHARNAAAHASNSIHNAIDGIGARLGTHRAANTIPSASKYTKPRGGLGSTAMRNRARNYRRGRNETVSPLVGVVNKRRAAQQRAAQGFAATNPGGALRESMSSRMGGGILDALGF